MTRDAAGASHLGRRSGGEANRRLGSNSTAEAARGQGIAVSESDIDDSEIAEWDPVLTKRPMRLARPIYALTHDIMLVGPAAKLLRRTGYIRAACANAAAALRAGAVVIDFPGGDYDACRPTWSRNTIDFTAAPDTPARPSTPGFRSCRWCPSARKRTSCSVSAADRVGVARHRG
jgi:hypothetical protein